jgi:predicted O-methyltransferase YrrM
MTDEINHRPPENYEEICQATLALGFTMASEIKTCSLLRTLAASKPSGKFLDMGTGTGLSAAWILDGMDEHSTLTSIDNEIKFQNVAQRFLGNDKRLELVLTDGGEWVEKNRHRRFDFIFADTWHGKFLLLEEVLGMLNKGGLYILDDMTPVSTWPAGHQEKVTHLISCLESRTDLILTKQAWATGIIVAVRR